MPVSSSMHWNRRVHDRRPVKGMAWLATATGVAGAVSTGRRNTTILCHIAPRRPNRWRRRGAPSRHKQRAAANWWRCENRNARGFIRSLTPTRAPPFAASSPPSIAASPRSKHEWLPSSRPIPTWPRSITGCGPFRASDPSWLRPSSANCPGRGGRHACRCRGHRLPPRRTRLNTVAGKPGVAHIPAFVAENRPHGALAHVRRGPGRVASPCNLPAASEPKTPPLW